MGSFFKSFCTERLSKFRRNAMFLTVRNYRNEFDEVSDFSVVFHIDYLNAVKRSREIIKLHKIGFKDCQGKKFSLQDLDTAKSELLSSYSDTLAGFNPRYTCQDVYDQVLDCDGKVIPGIKLHLAQDVLHLEGYRVQKKVLTPGKYPVVEHHPITMAKNFLRAKTPVDRWGQWKLVPKRFSQINVEAISISDQQVLRCDW